MERWWLAAVLAACVVAHAAAKLAVLDPHQLRADVELGKKTLGGAVATGGEGTLVLTPYLESGQVAMSRVRARVRFPPFQDDSITSYSGFFTVDKRFDAHIFFWFFPAEEPAYGQGAPLLVWLQGGPGSSSMFGLFTELGPYRVGANDTLEVIPNSWHTNHSVVFFDNPVGTGFSYADSEGYSTNQTAVADNLYSALTQFYSMFPEMSDRDLYLTGESYAGKYVPSFAHTIHERNPTAEPKIKLKGLLIGNGYSDPISMFQYSDYVYQLGLVDSKCRDEMKESETEGVNNARDGNYEEALWYRYTLMHKFASCSEYSHLYNYLHSEEPQPEGDYTSFLQREDVRRAIHVGNIMFRELNYDVYFSMQPDIMLSVKPQVEELLDAGYRVVFYSGQMDIIVAYPLSVNFFNTLEFAAADEYRTAERRPWHVRGELAGYAKTAGNFTEVMVRNAGHMVPSDQPSWALDLVRRVTSGEGF